MLLGELHQAILAIGSNIGLLDVAVGVALVLNIGVILGADNHVDVLAGDADIVALVLHLGGLQGVQRQLAGLLAGHAGVAGEGSDEVVVQAGDRADGSDLHGPAGAGEALDVTLVAQSAQQHLREGEAGQGAGGTEGAVRVAVDVAGGLAVRDNRGKGVGHGHVLVRSGRDLQGSGGLGADHQRNDDLGGGAAGQSPSGLEVAALIAGDDTELVENRNCFLVLNFTLVGEVLVLGGAGANGDQRHGHNQRHYQRKELLHGFSSLKICRFRRSPAPRDPRRSPKPLVSGPALSPRTDPVSAT
ncbi:hypothetical protein SDC9_122450 [bioreactor metagenome]|uniref:Uncharacterized protein n=1 Tax=bioreactor metagenome TaxID=1076179 RepID=A0A645CES0_9ZZZZ